MNRRSFLKLLGMASSVVAMPAASQVLRQIPAPAPMRVPMPYDTEEITTGWNRLPSGLIQMWGESDADGKVSFPLVARHIVSVHAIGSDDEPVLVLNASNTGCRLTTPGLYMALAY